MPKTVMLSETAPADAGMPQGAPVRVMAIGVLSARVPGRMSNCRQGVTPMKGSGLVTSPIVVSPPRDFAGLKVAGAGQLGIASLPRARPVRKIESRPSNDTL
jgi:hypothetical protein